MNVDPDGKVDVGNILTKNSSEKDDPTAVYSSLRKLRRFLSNADSVGEFRSADGVKNLLILFKRFSISLITLHNSNNNKKDENRNKYDKIVNETVGLLANCCHLDEDCKFVIKTSQFLTHLASLLQVDSLNLDIVASSVRLLGNLCNVKECASCVLQTKSLISLVVHWMVKEIDFTKIPNIDRVNKVALARAKICDLALRMFQLISKCSRRFACFLMQNDVACHVAKFLTQAAECKEKNKPTFKGTEIPKEKLLATLIELASCKDQNFAEQIVRANLSEELMRLINDHSDNGRSACSSEQNKCKSSREICQLARRLLFCCISDYSDIRIEVAKYGAIEFVHTLATSQRKSGVVEKDANLQYIMLLSKFCRDAFTRVKLRETDALSTLLDAFADTTLDLEAKNELMTCFRCFLYDNNGLVYLLKRPSFLSTMVDLLRKYSTENKCTFGHSSSTSRRNDGGLLEDEDKLKPLYRPDSPSYVQLRSRISLEESAEQQQRPTHKLCKEFFCPSPSQSPSYYSGASSPGRSWSPSNSVLSRSPSWSSESMSDEDVGGEDDGAEFFRNEWIEESLSAAPFDSSKRCYAKSLCTCAWTPSTASELCWESLINSIASFLSFLSHTDNYVKHLIADKTLLEAVVSYIGSVCRPQPRAGRVLKRLARNRNATENLLKMEFHRLISSVLCSFECHVTPYCIRCRKLNRIGSDIMLSLSAQVDSDFGFGILAHDILSGSLAEKFSACCTTCCLIKTSGRRKRLLIEKGGFEEILSGFFDTTDRYTNEKSLKAFAELVTRQKLAVMWSNEMCRIDVDASLDCEFSASKLTVSNSPDNENSSKKSTNSIVKFVSEDDEDEEQKTLEVDKNSLIRHSPFYSGMFAGHFLESSKPVLTCKDSGVAFKSLEIFIHLLYGCRVACAICRDFPIDWRHVIDLLTLSNQHLRDDLFRYVVDYVVAGFVQKTNVGQFLTLALLYESTRLFEICIIYMLLFCDERETCDIFRKLLADNCRLKDLLKKYLEIFLRQFI